MTNQPFTISSAYGSASHPLIFPIRHVSSNPTFLGHQFASHSYRQQQQQQQPYQHNHCIYPHRRQHQQQQQLIPPTRTNNNTNFASNLSTGCYGAAASGPPRLIRFINTANRPLAQLPQQLKTITFPAPFARQHEWTFVPNSGVAAAKPVSPALNLFQQSPPPAPQKPTNTLLLRINFNNYVVGKIIYKSPNSWVYKATCTETGAKVAVKEQILTPFNGSLASFNNEIYILKYLMKRQAKVVKLVESLLTLRAQITLITPIHDSECKLVANKAFSVMELGRSLRKIMGTGPVPEPTRKMLWCAMIDAVDSLHRNRVIHTDIKPDNFIYSNDGGLKLIDFGFSLVLPKGADGVKYKSRGTRNYLSPEVAGNISDCVYTTKVDIWGLGCILYEMAYGETPFRYIEYTEPKLSAISNPLFPISFPPLKDSSHLLDLLRKCFNRNPSKRPSIVELKKHPYCGPTE